LLNAYLQLGQKGHTLQNMAAALAFHDTFIKTGDMRKVEWGKYI